MLQKTFTTIITSVVGIVDDFTFEFIFSSSPAFGISGFEFYIAREFAFGKSDDTSINIAVSDVTGDVQNTYKSTDHAIVANTGIPTHKIGTFCCYRLRSWQPKVSKTYSSYTKYKITKNCNSYRSNWYWCKWCPTILI